MKVKHLDLGAMPVNLFNDKLDHDLEVGRVVMTRNAIQHVRKNHPDDYEKCFPYLVEAIQNPLFVGDDFKNPGNVELIGRGQDMKTGELIMIAINFKPDDNGDYHLRSFYPYSNEKAAKRRIKGFLRSAL